MCCRFFFKQKTAYEMRISDWSSDVCSSDLAVGGVAADEVDRVVHALRVVARLLQIEAEVAENRRGAAGPGRDVKENGRASGRDRVCQYVQISVVAVSVKKQKTKPHYILAYQDLKQSHQSPVIDAQDL